MTNDRLTVFTIGHSTHSLEVFVEMLTRHDISALGDVRSAPFSRFNPRFNKDALARDLKARGIKYVFLGRELGARSGDRSNYENGRVQYGRLARTGLFAEGIERVKRGAEEYRIALMCAEKEPLECHRTLLVARALNEQGVGVMHILGDGQIETHECAMERLLGMFGLGHQEFLRSHAERVAEALERQEKKVAYVDEKLSAEAKEVSE